MSLMYATSCDESFRVPSDGSPPKFLRVCFNCGEKTMKSLKDFPLLSPLFLFLTPSITVNDCLTDGEPSVITQDPLTLYTSRRVCM